MSFQVLQSFGRLLYLIVMAILIGKVCNIYGGPANEVVKHEIALSMNITSWKDTPQVYHLLAHHFPFGTAIERSLSNGYFTFSQ